MENEMILNGSICVTDLVEAINKGHSAGTRSAKNGKFYANVTIFVNKEPDKFKQDGSIILNSTVEGKKLEAEKKSIYVGHVYKGGNKSIAAGEANLAITLPGGGAAPAAGAAAAFAGPAADDLPF